MGTQYKDQLDLTFFTNDENGSLLNRFKKVLKTTKYFDILVGYFRASGFYNLYDSLENVEKIRVIVGLKLDEHTWDIHRFAHSDEQINFKSTELIKSDYRKELLDDIQSIDDNFETNTGLIKFIEFIRSGKLEMKVYPHQAIHAKVYILRKPEGDEDFGRVITGSSNFSYSGLQENLEFNVELKQGYDVRFALEKFEALWAQSIDITEDFVQTVTEETWVNDSITPYELYLKFLYEYFKVDLGYDYDLIRDKYPEDFMDLEYQRQAVVNALKIIEEHGGVFISDVVGLGKTYIASMIAGQLEGHTLVLASPVLLDETNPGSWKNVMRDFNVQATFESIGKLDKIDQNRLKRIKNIIVDEAHAFRTETNKTYEQLATICHGKKVILVTATPYNNRPDDLFAQIRLFQKGKQSTIPGVKNLQGLFAKLNKLIDPSLRNDDYEKYVAQVKEVAKQIRNRVLKHLMVRRTRTEIMDYFGDDLRKQGLHFPEVKAPVPFYYELDKTESRIFDKTLTLLAEEFKYTRYAPMLYYLGKMSEMERQSQRNLVRFMKILLVKRLESSFYAFRKSLDRFIRSYEFFIKLYDEGFVYFSPKHLNKIFDYMEDENIEAVDKLIREGKAEKIPADQFSSVLRDDLVLDLDTLKAIKKDWDLIKRDPKLIKFIDQLKNDNILNKNKLIVFTESRETAEYLQANLETHFPGKILLFTGSSDASLRVEVIYNFDAKSKVKNDTFRILIATEVLAEGVNLHRSNVVINYDIPWNPTRMMQRVGRVNRVDTSFDEIYTYNFFPSEQGNDAIKIAEIAKAKIHSFITLLGADSKLLTESEEIEQFELFDRLNSKASQEEEETESPLQYLKEIRDIKENNQELFKKITELPIKAKSSKKGNKVEEGVLTYIKKGKIEKIYFCNKKFESEEIEFLEAAKLLKTEPVEKQTGYDLQQFYELIGANQGKFREDIAEDEDDATVRGSGAAASKLTIQVKFLLNSFKTLPHSGQGIS
jgi:superfamily II DNA/RNA helicase/HKD family nuclease